MNKCLGLCVATVGLGVSAAAGYLVLSPRPETRLVAPVTKPILEGPGHIKAPELLQAALTRLHGEAVERFLARPGNGMGRLLILPEKVDKPWSEPFYSPGEIERETPVTSPGDLAKIHQESLRHFKDPAPRPVAGVQGVFLVDAIKKMKEKDWEIKSLDLVGLVKHAEPAVYVSEKLPDMKDLDDVPTRTPDFFEQAGLDHLQKGNDLFIREREGAIRMLGAVRASASCVRCHRTPEGTLLGAFSYTLRPALYVDPRKRTETK